MLYTPAFWAMAVANLCHTASFSALFLLPLYILDHGGDQGDVGLIMGIFALASALCRPWVSEMIDRIGRKRSYSLGSMLMLVAPLLYLPLHDPLGRDYLLLLALRSLHGIGLAICFTAVFTYMADLIPQQRFNEGVGMFGISGLLGVALGPLVGEVVLGRAGYPGLFLAAAALALVALLAHQPLRESWVNHERRRSAGFFAQLRQGQVRTVALLSLLFGLGLAATGNFVAPLAEARQLGVISAYYLAYSGGAVGARVLVGRLADRVGERRVLPYGLLLYLGGLWLLPVSSLQLLFVGAGLCAGCGHGLLFPTLNTLAVRGQPAEARGKATGLFTGSIDSGAFAGSLLLGYIGKALGLNALFIFAGLGMLTGLLLLRSAPSHKE